MFVCHLLAEQLLSHILSMLQGNPMTLLREEGYVTRSKRATYVGRGRGMDVWMDGGRWEGKEKSG